MKAFEDSGESGNIFSLSIASLHCFIQLMNKQDFTILNVMELVIFYPTKLYLIYQKSLLFGGQQEQTTPQAPPNQQTPVKISLPIADFGAKIISRQNHFP